MKVFLKLIIVIFCLSSMKIAVAIEHIPSEEGRLLQQQLQQQFEEMHMFYNEVFGNGSFERLNLTVDIINTTYMRAQIIAQCIANSDRKLVGCEREMRKANLIGYATCGAISAFGGPVIGGIAIAACSYYAASTALDIPIMCGNIRTQKAMEKCSKYHS